MSEISPTSKDGSEALKGVSHISNPRRHVLEDVGDVEDQIRREKLRSLKGGETSADEHDLALWISGTLKKYITNLPYKLEYDPGYVSIGATNYLWDKVSAKIQIQEAKYQGGFLKLKGINRSTNQQESYQISLRDFFVMKEGDLFPDDEKLNIMLSSPIQESKKSIDKLKQDLEIESYFGGAVVVSYERVDQAQQAMQNLVVGAGMATVGVGAIATTAKGFDTGRKIYREGQYRVKKIVYKDQNITRVIDSSFLDSITNKMVGSKGKLAAMIMPIMKQAGLVFNVMRNAFTSTHQYAIDKTASAVAHMKYNPAYGGSITDFENTKRDIKLRLQQASQKNFQSLQSLTRFLTNQTRTVAAVGKVGASLGMSIFGVLMINTCFMNYQKNSHDSGALVKDAILGGGFLAGSIGGAKLLSKVPIVGSTAGKVAGGIVGGVGGMIGMEKFMEQSAVRRSLWKQMPNRFAGDVKKSFLGHALSMGTINDALDKIDMDIGVGGFSVSMPFVHKQVIVPEVKLNRTSVNFGIDPRSYLAEGIRDVGFYNKRMDEFTGTESMQGVGVKKIMTVLRDYRLNIGLFGTESISGYMSDRMSKKDVLKERLSSIIGGSEISEKSAGIVEDTLEYIAINIADIKNPVEQERQLQMFLRNYGNVMKLSSENIDSNRKELAKDESYLHSLGKEFIASLTTNKQAYAQGLLKHMMMGKKIVNNPREQALFDQLINSNMPLTDFQRETYNLFDPAVRTYTQGDYFCFLLENYGKFYTEMLFLKSISKTGYGVEWESI